MTGCHDPAPGLTGSHYPACHRFFRRSPRAVLAWVWGLFTFKPCALTSNTNRQQSDFGPVDDTVGSLSSADITESLASPSPRSQRLGLALRNQWVDPITQRHSGKNELPLFHLVKAGQHRQILSVGRHIHAYRNPRLSHTRFYENKVSGQRRFRRDNELL